MTDRRAPTYADLVYDVLRSADRSLTFPEIFDRVNQRRPVTTRNPKATIRSALGAGRQLISLGDGRYGYLPRLVEGSLLRLPLAEKKPANHPLIYPDDLRHALWPSFLENRKRRRLQPVTARLPTGEDVPLALDFLGTGTWGGRMPEPLRRFLVDHRAAAGDALLIRVVDGEAGRCEIRFESRLQRDSRAVAARDRELADAAAQVLRADRSMNTPIWDLAVLLLARGAYRSDVAPHPLETVLRDDPRFADGGLHGWVLAERLTPELEAEIHGRRQLERELLAAFSGVDVPTSSDDDLDAVSSPHATRLALERVLTNLNALMGEREPASVEETNALLEGLVIQGDLPRRSASTPLEQAQDLMYDAWEAPSSRERVRLARKALTISQDCADAYVLLAEETARTPEEAAALYARGVAAGEHALGQETFEQDVGYFWGLLGTRPYMRARLGLAQALWAMGDRQGAVEHLRDMLRLNPGDNQGVRYVLLNWLLEIDAPDQVEALLAAYPDDAAAVWTYGRALHAFRRQGDTPASRRQRAEARRSNPHVPAYLSGRKRLPRQLPELIGIGDESEAIVCAAEQRSAWQMTPGALAWLEGSTR